MSSPTAKNAAMKSGRATGVGVPREGHDEREHGERGAERGAEPTEEARRDLVETELSDEDGSGEDDDDD